MINHSIVKDSNGRRGAKSGHDLEEEAAEAAREEEIETTPEAGRQGVAAAAEGSLAWQATARAQSARSSGRRGLRQAPQGRSQAPPMLP